MSSFICRTYATEIIDSENGYITECPHWPKEELNALSRAKTHDGMSIDHADNLAMHLLKKQKPLA